MRFKTAVACSAAFAAAAMSANAGVFAAGDTLGYASVGAVVVGPPDVLGSFGTGVVLGTPSGGFVGVAPTLSLWSPLSEAALPGGPVWTDGTWSFTATAPIVITAGTTAGFYELTTSGTVTDGTYSAPAVFALAVTPITGGPVGYYGAITTVVPEPGTYALLAGLGLVGFAGYRRFRS